LEQVELINGNQETGVLSGKIMVFTGKLSISRSEAKAIAEKFGAKISSSITKSTDIVVLGQDAGKKRIEAEKLGVQIMTEEEWRRLVSEKPANR
jgi:DNA ligase (NAD+)